MSNIALLAWPVVALMACGAFAVLLTLPKANKKDLSRKARKPGAIALAESLKKYQKELVVYFTTLAVGAGIPLILNKHYWTLILLFAALAIPGHTLWLRLKIFYHHTLRDENELDESHKKSDRKTKD